MSATGLFFYSRVRWRYKPINECNGAAYARRSVAPYLAVLRGSRILPCDPACVLTDDEGTLPGHFDTPAGGGTGRLLMTSHPGTTHTAGTTGPASSQQPPTAQQFDQAIFA